MKKVSTLFVIVLGLGFSSLYFYQMRATRVLTMEGVIAGIVSFVNRYYKDFIPYEVKDNHVISDKREYVRNIATMYDLMRLQAHWYAGERSMHGIHASVMQEINENAEYYLRIYKRNPSDMRQASAFLALLLQRTSEAQYEKDIAQITHTLYTQLGDLEPRFELGEVLMALSIIDPKPAILDAQINRIIENIQKNDPSVEDLFQYNWLSKFIAVYKNDASATLFRILHEKVIRVLPLLTYEEETNYLAVTYECLASLHSYDSSIEVDGYLEKLMAALMKRYNRTYGLFAFKNGDMRFDITGHILNGFIDLHAVG